MLPPPPSSSQFSYLLPKICCHKPSFWRSVGFAPIASAPPSEAKEEHKFSLLPYFCLHTAAHTLSSLRPSVTWWQNRCNWTPPPSLKKLMFKLQLPPSPLCCSLLLPPNPQLHTPLLTIDSEWHLTKTPASRLNAGDPRSDYLVVSIPSLLSSFLHPHQGLLLPRSLLLTSSPFREFGGSSISPFWSKSISQLLLQAPKTGLLLLLLILYDAVSRAISINFPPSWGFRQIVLSAPFDPFDPVQCPWILLEQSNLFTFFKIF